MTKTTGLLLSILFIVFPCSTYGETCYELGYRYGMCATKSFYGIPCRPENDIVIPAKCRGVAETERGIKAGAEAVYDILNIDKKTGRPIKSSSLNMLTTSLSTLRNRLKGKAMNEVRGLVGNPDRKEVVMGKKCWIYGNTYTDQDRAIVFHEGRVLTVTFY